MPRPGPSLWSPSAEVGFWDRPERLVLMILGVLTNRMEIALWFLAIGPNITVVHRIVHTWKHTKAYRACSPPQLSLKRALGRGIALRPVSSATRPAAAAHKASSCLREDASKRSLTSLCCSLAFRQGATSVVPQAAPNPSGFSR